MRPNAVGLSAAPRRLVGSRQGRRRAPAAVLAVSLIFDPTVIEGEWEQGRPGAIIGGTATLTAFLAAGFIGDPGHGSLADAAGAG